MEDERRLFVGGLPTDIEEEEMRMVFETYGQVTDVYMLLGKEGGDSKAAFVAYEEVEAARDAIDALDTVYKFREDGPKPITVKVANAKGEKGSYGGKGKSVGKGGHEKGGSYESSGGYGKGAAGYTHREGYDRGDAYGHHGGKGGYDDRRDAYDRGGKGGYDRDYDRRDDYDRGGRGPGYDRGGKGGYDRSDGYDRGGHAYGGYDRGHGYDRDGHNRGHNTGPHDNGYARGRTPPFEDRSSYSRSNGFDRDYEDRDRGGYAQGGYDRPRDRYDGGGYDRGGHDRGGYDRGGNSRGGYNRGNDDYGGYDSASYDRGGPSRGGRDEDKGKGKGNSDAKLYVLSLPADITKDTLETVFSTYGPIVDMHIMYGRAKSGQSSAFVVYADPRDARTAIAAMEQGYEICPGEGNITVKMAADKSGGSGKGGDRYAPY